MSHDIAKPLAALKAAPRRDEGRDDRGDVLGRPAAVRQLPRRDRRSHLRLFEAERRRRDDAAPVRPCRGGGARGAPRRVVRRRDREPDGGARGAAHGAAQRLRQADDGAGQGRDARRHRGARSHGRVRRGDPLRHDQGVQRRALHRRRQYRHWRLRPRPGDGRARRCRRSSRRSCRCTSSPTWTAPTSATC